MAPAEFEVTLGTLSDEQLKKMKLPDSHIWFLKDGELMQGPYEENELKNYMAKNSAFMSHYEACNAEEMKWKPAFDHIRLQRRRPIANESSEGYKLLIAGQIVGPFSQEEVQEKLHKSEISYSDLISEDSKKWMRIYHYTEFERREKPELPFLPDQSSFERSNIEVQDYLQSEKRLNVLGKEDALIGLAYNGEDAKVIDETEIADGLPPYIEESMVGEKAGTEQVDSVDDIPLPIEDEVLTPEQMKKDKNKTMIATAGALTLILMVVFGGKLFFKKEDSSQIAKNPAETKTPMQQNYRQNKETISFGNGTPVESGTRRRPASRPAVPTQQNQKVRDAFKNARKMQQTHQQNIRREAAGDEYRDDEYKDDRAYDNGYPPDEEPLDREPLDREDTLEKDEMAQIRKEQINDEEGAAVEDDNADEFFEEEVGDF